MPIPCDSCSSSFVQYGTLAAVVHESGCPRSDSQRSCKWCGSSFEVDRGIVDHRGAGFCSHSCCMAYRGVDCDCFECCHGASEAATRGDSK